MVTVKSFFLYLSLLLSALFFTFSFFRPIFVDFDLGRHLLFGKIMLETGDIIRSNTTSYTYPEFEYVLSHWLPEIIFYLFQSRLGFEGLTVLLVSVSFLTIGSVLAFAYKRVGPSAIAFVLPLYTYFLVVRSDPRPEIFSYLFLAIFLVLLYKFREKYTNWIFLLVLVEAFWVNMHIYFALGPALVFAFLVDSILTSKKRINKNSKTLLVVFLLVSLATLINPFFIKGVLNPIFFLSNYGVLIEENLNAYYILQAFNWIGYIPHMILLGSTYLLLFIYRKKMYLVDWILVIVFTLASLMAIRNFYVFLYVNLYIYLRLTSFFFIDLNKFLKRWVSKKQLVVLKTIAYFYLCAIVLTLISILFFMNGFGFGVVERGKSGIDFYEKNNLKGPIYNSFDLGQYISYRLYPEEKVYVDGRPEAYPEAFFSEEYNASLYDFNTFLDVDEKRNFNTYIVYLNYFNTPDLIPEIIKNDNYKLIFLDTFMMILVKNNEENKKIIEKHEVAEESFKLPKNADVQVMSKHIILFDQIGWKEKELEIYNQMLDKGMTTCYLKRLLRVRTQRLQELNNIKDLPEENCKI